MRRILDSTANAVGGYVQGALTIALIAGIQAFIVMEILGVPFAAPLAVLAGLASLIPLVGATAAAIVIGLVTLFNDFPTDTIIWAIWAIIYQQIENNLIQPQVQRRTVQVQPFVVLVAVLFGCTLLGVLGAIVAIPLAASIQILMREWWDWRAEMRQAAIVDPDGPLPPAPPGWRRRAAGPRGRGPGAHPARDMSVEGRLNPLMRFSRRSTAARRRARPAARAAGRRRRAGRARRGCR